MLSFASLRPRLRHLAGSLCLLAAAACSSDKTPANSADILVSNDFESLAGWLGPTPVPTLTQEKAHSGRYSIKVDAASEYSLSFANTLGALHDVRVKKIKATCWVYVPSAQAAALLVTHGGDQVPNTKPLIWDGFDVVKAVGNKYNQWVEVSKEIDVPETATAQTNIGFYLWRSAGSEQPVYLDDLVVTAEPEA